MERHLTHEHLYAWLKYAYRLRNQDTPDHGEILGAIPEMPDDLVCLLASSTVTDKVKDKEEKEKYARILELAKEEWARRAEKVLLGKKKDEDKDEHK